VAAAHVEVEIAERDDGWLATVRVEAGATSTEHEVTVRRETYDALTAGVVAPEELVRASFAFLLEREPPSAILRQFDLDAISRYFPEYEREVRKYFVAR
jgi:hypothetical protein